MKHRSDYRTAAEESVAHTFIPGVTIDDAFDAEARLKALAPMPLPETVPDDAPRVLHVSMYCYKSFPIRIFHVLSLKDGLNSHAVFFKNNFTNDHLPVTGKELDLLVDLVKDVDPHMITFSVLAPYVVATRQAVAAIREVSDAMIVIGGKYPTIAPHEALEFADYACKGEADLTMLRIHERLRQGRDLRGLRGLWYKDDDGQVVDMDQDALYQEMDDIPYPAIAEMQMHFIEKNSISEVDPELFDDEMLVMAGRGCVYLCSFCVNSLLIPMNRGNGRFVRIRSPEHVLEEIDYRLAKCRRPSIVTFNDEVFGVWDDWVEDFSKVYKDRCDIPFECELVPRLVKENNMRALAGAGMVSMHFGVQSGHDDVRNDIMHRPGSNDELIEKSDILKRVGITPQYDIILDNPFDTAESLSEALRLLLAFDTPIRLNTYKMQYFPHYPFTMMALEAGHVKPDQVTDEGIADAVMYNMVYRPKFPALNRRDYLENCIYLVPWWNKLWIRRVLFKLQKAHNPLLGDADKYSQYFRPAGLRAPRRRRLDAPHLPRPRHGAARRFPHAAREDARRLGTLALRPAEHRANLCALAHSMITAACW
ncbi:MAG: radical SAM protein [Rhodospirillaceae bacterium]